MASQDGSGSSDDDDYDMHQPGLEQRARYPIHDCCEFEDAETLRVSPLVCLVVFHRGIHRPWSIVGWRELMGWVSLPARCSFAVGRLASLVGAAARLFRAGWALAGNRKIGKWGKLEFLHLFFHRIQISHIAFFLYSFRL